MEAAEASAEKFNWSAKPKEIYINAQYLGTTGPEGKRFLLSFKVLKINFLPVISFVFYPPYMKKLNI